MRPIGDAMEIPAFFTSSDGEGLSVNAGRFSGTVPETSGRAVALDSAASAAVDRTARSPAVVIDCDSLRGRFFSEKVLKGMRVRGADIWFMTHVEDADDVFDAFNTNAEMLLVPYHTVRSDGDMEDIHSVSDSVIPTVFVENGRAIRRKGSAPLRAEDVLERLTDIGFYRHCVVDTDDSVPGSEWESILDEWPSTIVFDPSARVSEMGPRGTIVPFRP